jgi:hypothetical protein
MINSDDANWLIRSAAEEGGGILSPLFVVQVHIVIGFHFACVFVGFPTSIHIFNSNKIKNCT